MPPRNRLRSAESLLLRLLRPISASRTAGVSLAIGSNFCSRQSAIDLSVGMTTAAGPPA